MRTLIQGGLLIDPALGIEEPKDILLEDGKVAAVLPPRGAKGGIERVIDARGRWVLPGLIDMHVHLREPGREEDETIASGTRAAAAGGVTTVLAMPNTEPVVDTPALVRMLRDRARAEAKVNVLVAGAVTRGQKGEALAELGLMRRAGAAAFTDDGRPIMNAGLMRRALEYAAGLGAVVLDHCEDLNLSAGGAVHEGARASSRGLPGQPAEAESVMVERDLALAARAGARLHLCHLSCAASLEAARRAKSRGVPVTVETAPHYFTLTDEDAPEGDADFKINPPLRGRADLEAVLAALADGTIDAVATDHAPHSPAKKGRGLLDAPCGVIGLETLLPLVLGLARSGVLSRRRAVELVTAGPARALGLASKGTLRPGADADLAVVDPDAEWTAGGGHSLSRNTPFKGRAMRGRAVTVLVGGRTVVEDGRLA